MPRTKKGPRLWLRPARFDKDGKLTHAATYVILAGKQIATGCAEGEASEAEQRLAAYIDAKHEPRRLRRIEQITIAEVLSIYDQDKGHEQANQRTYLSRMQRLNDWWGAKVLADVNGQTSRAYAASRGNRGGARRDLQDLQAAITYHMTQGLHREVVKVALPEAGHPRSRWLTRSEAARLVWAAWRFREAQKRSRGSDKGKTLPTSKRPLQHVARFILIALYTGTRAEAVASASPYREEGRSWVDLDAGVFYRLQEGRKGTNKRQPPVRLPTHLLAHLRRWKEHAIATSHFVEFNGKPIGSVSKGFAHAVELAGLEGNVTPHTLRHTAATWLAQNGTSKEDASSFLGMSTAIFERTYWHHSPDFQKAAAGNFRPKRPAKETPTERVNTARTDANDQAPGETPNA